jgi:hypothetical protein
MYGLNKEFSILGRAGRFLLYEVQTGCEAHRASYPENVGIFSSGVKRPGPEADHSPISSGSFKNAWSHVFYSGCIFICLVLSSAQVQL